MSKEVIKEAKKDAGRDVEKLRELSNLILDQNENVPDFTIVLSKHYELYKYRVDNNKGNYVSDRPTLKTACNVAKEAQIEKNRNDEAKQKYEKEHGQEIDALIEEILSMNGIDKKTAQAAINSADRDLENLKELIEQIDYLQNSVPDFKVKTSFWGSLFYEKPYKVTGTNKRFANFEDAFYAAKKAQIEKNKNDLNEQINGEEIDSLIKSIDNSIHKSN